MFSTPVGNGNDNAYMPNTVDYGGQSWKQDGTGGFVGTGPLYGDNQYHYQNFGGDGAFNTEGDARMSSWSPEKMFAASLAGLVGGGLAMGGPAGFGFGGAGGAGAAGGSLAGDAFLPGALGVDGAAMGTGALPGLEGYLVGGAAGGAAGGASGGMLAGDATMPGALGVGGANMSNAALPGLESYVTGTTGLLSPGMKTALGVGSTLLGAAAGAQGQKGESTTTRSITPELMPYLNGQDGLWGKVAGLLNKQSDPAYMQPLEDMRAKGMGLLSQPSMGNGFNRFFPGVK